MDFQISKLGRAGWSSAFLHDRNCFIQKMENKINQENSSNTSNKNHSPKAENSSPPSQKQEKPITSWSSLFSSPAAPAPTIAQKAPKPTIATTESPRTSDTEEIPTPKASISLSGKILSHDNPNHNSIITEALEQSSPLIQRGHYQFPHLQRRGLKNRGNLCFLNVTLQILLSAPPFALLFSHLKDVNFDPQSSFLKRM